jgi:hypothetical protein
MKRTFMTGMLVMLSCAWLFAAAPKLLLSDGQQIERLKAKIKAGDQDALKLYQSLSTQADQFLTMKPVSVMEKAFKPTSGNKHDYMSQAPYFWYDSTKTNGLPYMRRDGVRNPEISKIIDRKNIGSLENAIRYLSAAYYLSDDEKYAGKAAQLLRTWFTDAETKMNPNLNYAQGIPGVNDGRGIGIIETLALTGIADGIELLSTSKRLTDTDRKDIKKWYADYLTWLLTSKNGRDEKDSENNHGTYYDMQVLDFALFTGQTDFAKKYINSTLLRMNKQLEPDGKQPLELTRTQALHYSTFNLDAWFKVASIADKMNVDVWNYKAQDGRCLKKAIDWLLPYVTGDKAWPYQQITKYEGGEMYPLLLQAYAHYKDDNYQTIALN